MMNLVVMVAARLRPLVFCLFLVLLLFTALLIHVTLFFRVSLVFIRIVVVVVVVVVVVTRVFFLAFLFILISPPPCLLGSGATCSSPPRAYGRIADVPEQQVAPASEAGLYAGLLRLRGSRVRLPDVDARQHAVRAKKTINSDHPPISSLASLALPRRVKDEPCHHGAQVAVVTTTSAAVVVIAIGLAPCFDDEHGVSFPLV